MTTRHLSLLAAALLLGTPAAAVAANADHPYQNIDPRNDAGNPTGDDQTDRLNQAQLGQTGALARPRSWWDRGQGAPQRYARPYAPPNPVYGGALRGPDYYPPPPPAYYRPPGPPPGYPY